MTLIDKLFPNKLPSMEEIEARYPPRNLKPEQRVTRQGPSPTGFMHIGTVYAALISERLAHQSDGVFFLRIEDTDTKREVKEATDLIVTGLKTYDLIPDEGIDEAGNNYGPYGPYRQSERKEIYQAVVKWMVQNGLAYPAFETPEELDEMRAQQEKESVRPGYYGKWAKSRLLSEKEIEAKIDTGIPFIFRFKSPGNYDRKITIKDVLRGETTFPENDTDVVILKSDGLPTYHMAHVIDDHFMGTTLVPRADEWYASLPLHIQLFKAMGWKPPKYAHLAPIQKMEGTSRRKISKRKDPEASVSYYDEQGYPKNAVLEYLLNLANSNFEDWRKLNLDKPLTDFKVELSKLSRSGALFDFVKLNSIGREVIGRMTKEEVYSAALIWAEDHDTDLAALMKSDKAYVTEILGIERTGQKNARKDLAKWNELKPTLEYFFDDRFKPVKLEGVKNIFDAVMATYDPADTKDDWFAKMKTVAAANGYATDGKAYKENPSAFKGNMADFAKIFRLILTGKPESPDLYSIMQVMGKDRILNRGKNI